MRKKSLFNPILDINEDDHPISKGLTSFINFGVGYLTLYGIMIVCIIIGILVYEGWQTNKGSTIFLLSAFVGFIFFCFSPFIKEKYENFKKNREEERLAHQIYANKKEKDQ